MPCDPLPQQTAGRRRRVIFIGIVGLSAAGKSTVAHRVAQHLRSPLHPITLDDFYMPAACEALGTFDDFRTVDFARFASELRTLRLVLSEELSRLDETDDGLGRARESEAGRMIGGQDWRTRLAHRLPPSFTKYITAETDIPQDENVGVGQGSHDGDSDESLRAHEQEEAALRARRRQASAKEEDSDSDAVFAVCEGFSLFCSEAVAAADLFDVCVWVRCPVEEACRRRFARTPRRHPRASGQDLAYRARIEQLWRTRTEARRQELRDVLVRGLGLEAEAQDDVAPPNVRAALALVAPGPESPFFPPRRCSTWSRGPRRADGAVLTAADCWDPATGAPTDVFDDLWQQCQQRYGEGRAQPGRPFFGEGSACDVCIIPSATAGAHGVREGAASCPSFEASGVVTPAVRGADETAAASHRRYAEFRYWFYGEVVFYSRLFLPLQEQHVAQCFGRRPAAGVAGADSPRGRLVASLMNNEGVSREALDEGAVQLAQEVVRFASASGRQHHAAQDH